jgi:hypothetical protein
MPGFMEVVCESWSAPMPHSEPCHVLFFKLRRTARALSMWSRRLFSNTKVLLHAALLLILHFDMAQDKRALCENERDFRAKLKRKVIALAG